MKKRLHKMFCLTLLSAVFMACTPEETIEPIFKLNSPESGKIEMTAEGDKATVEFTTNNNWSLSIDEDCDWVSSDVTSGEAGSEMSVKVNFTVAANEVEESRECKIRFKSRDLNFEVTVAQAAAEAKPVDKLELIHPAEGDIFLPCTASQYDIVFKSNIVWEFKAAENYDWLTISPMKGNGKAEGTITAKLDVSAFPQKNSTRTAAFELVAGEQKYEITVSQEGVKIYLELLNPEDHNIQLAPDGGIYEVKFRTNCNWAVQADYYLIDWISVQPENGTESEECTIKLNYYMNASDSVRNASLTLATDNLTSDNISLKFNVSQTNMGKGDMIDIPDATLKAMLVAEYDADGDNEINTTEALVAKDLDCSGNFMMSDEDKIQDLTGLEYFKNITSLTMTYGRFKEIDLTPFTQLTQVNVSINSNLSKIKVAGHTSISTLDISTTGITELDVSGCSTLHTLICGALNLETFDFIKGGENIKRIESDFNNHTSLDLSTFPKLEELQIWYNMGTITDINFKNNPNFKRLDVNGSDFTTYIDFSSCKQLSYVSLSYSMVNGVKFATENPYLETVLLNSAGVSEINLGKCPILQTLKVSGNNLKTLDLSGCPKMRTLHANGNGLETINTAGCDSLDLVYLEENQLTDASFIATMPKVRELYLADNQISEINTDYLAKCQSLDVSKNLLSGELDITAMPQRDLTVNVQNNTGLKTLWITTMQNEKRTALIGKVVLKVSDYTEIKIRQ